MKKLIVIALILALAPLANATMLRYAGGTGVTYNETLARYEVEKGETFTINVMSDVATANFVLNVKSDNHTVLVGLVNDLFNLTNIDGQQFNGVSPVVDLMIYKASGGVSSTSVPNTEIMYSFTAGAGPTEGVVWHFNSMATNGGSGPNQAVKLNGTTIVMSEFAVTVIPEPMTIALLGLGGLFMLRRRK